MPPKYPLPETIFECRKLEWPASVRRNIEKIKGKTHSGTTFYKIQKDILRVARLMRLDKIVVTTNKRGENMEPPDTAAAVYFQWQNEPHAIYCDRWESAKDNLRACYKHLRGMYELHTSGAETSLLDVIAAKTAGSVSTKVKFTLPKTTNWRRVFDFKPRTVPTSKEVKERFNVLAVRFHPDKGGDEQTMQRLNEARDAALSFVEKQEFLRSVRQVMQEARPGRS